MATHITTKMVMAIGQHAAPKKVMTIGQDGATKVEPTIRGVGAAANGGVHRASTTTNGKDHENRRFAQGHVHDPASTLKSSSYQSLTRFWNCAAAESTARQTHSFIMQGHVKSKGGDGMWEGQGG